MMYDDVTRCGIWPVGSCLDASNQTGRNAKEKQVFHGLCDVVLGEAHGKILLSETQKNLVAQSRGSITGEWEWFSFGDD